jgi:hypothetical protein
MDGDGDLDGEKSTGGEARKKWEKLKKSREEGWMDGCIYNYHNKNKKEKTLPAFVFHTNQANT